VTVKHSRFTDLPRLISQSRHNVRVIEDQCDCACASSLSAPQLSRIPLTDTSYLLYNSLSTIPLTADYHVTLSEQVHTPLVLNQPALTIANHFNQAHLLADVPTTWHKTWVEAIIQATLEQMITLGLLVPKYYDTLPFVEFPTTLSAWLHLTDRCNLRCAYCYLPHQPADMLLETGQAAIDATFRSALNHGYRQVKLKYAGGEPLLRFSTITGLHRYAQTLVDRHSLTLDGIVLSNGTLLTPEIVQMMKTLGIRLMISLDGLGEFHDRQRAHPGGQGSFVQVKQAVELARNNELVPDISITVSGRNAAGLPALIDWVLARDLPFSLNFYRENNFSAGYEDLQLEEARIIAGMLAAFKVIEARLPRQSVLPSLVDRANLASPHLRTCSVGHSYLVFDSLGQVAKCQMQLDHPLTTAAAADPLALVRADETGIQNVSVEEKEACRTCQWKYWCTGGCPLVAYWATGRYDVKSPNCNIYKALYPEAVRLEGLRLLKYGTEYDVVN
jgi:uncharacterized protein